MVLNREKGTIEHAMFYMLPQFLKEGDLLVFNKSKVIKARLVGTKRNGGARVELLLIRRLDDTLWEVIARPAKRLKLGTEVVFADGLSCVVEEVLDEGFRIVRFSVGGERFLSILESIGEVPTPPYIKRKIKDPSLYQTIYAEVPGSVAAPTAGFHFTDRVLEELRKKGIKMTFLILHVGAATFLPVRGDIRKHKVPPEYYEVPEECALEVNSALREGRRVIAVGTTTTRVLESVCDDNGVISPKKGWTDLFILPGFKFRVLKGLITNFHLPRTTLLALVSAFAGEEFLKRAYEIAVKERYRLYSFGDAMLIL
ncbi:MAG: S-adenosylmethionine:tRNA ribosyltransferase-isomerase [bacterium]|nr:MAG: S-adenosylmethionine:tRNA ribosyltransferase-isomerase [bacterium 42_11]MDK2871204.1 S-adenosylmethionine:tRNA ribosyltransferase-isomerase [bacterium]